MAPFTLRARWVLPIDGPPVSGGYGAIADGRLAAIGPVDPGVGPVTDLGDAVLMPGLINAHTHLEFSGLARPLGAAGISLPAWIRLVIAHRKQSDRDAAAAIAAGLRESLVNGVTSVGEIATSPASLYWMSTHRPTTLLFHESIGFSAGRVDSAFADLQRRLDAAPPPAGLSPHAPYTVHPRLFERIVNLATARNVPVAMHLAESPEELEFLAAGDGPFRELLQERSMWDDATIVPGSRPLDYLKRIAAAPRSLVIHGNYLTDEEIEFIAARRERMSVVFCPRTHGYFGHPPYPLHETLSAGVRVALGTDSRASNPDLSLLSELRFAAKNHGLVEPAALLRMATLDGAAALGLDSVAGSLTPGKRADLLAVPCNAAPADVYEAIVASEAPPLGVWLAGERVV